MTIIELGALGEFIGSIAVVASLIYVGLQVRLNSNAIRAASVIETKQLASSVSAMLSAPGMADVYLSGLKNSSDLSPTDRVLFNSLMLTLFSSYEASFFQSYYGTIPADILDPINAQAVFHLKRRGVRQWWDAGGKERFGRKFVNEIESIVDSDR
jgi:hypothetical protein